MATPHVTASIALILSLDSNLNPGLPRLTLEEVRGTLKATATDGKINLLGALEQVEIR